jgi:hypothetical protein
MRGKHSHAVIARTLNLPKGTVATIVARGACVGTRAGAHESLVDVVREIVKRIGMTRRKKGERRHPTAAMVRAMLPKKLNRVGIRTVQRVMEDFGHDRCSARCAWEARG